LHFTIVWGRWRFHIVDPGADINMTCIKVLFVEAKQEREDVLFVQKGSKVLFGVPHVPFRVLHSYYYGERGYILDASRSNEIKILYKKLFICEW
jgi:hypothetical protein